MIGLNIRDGVLRRDLVEGEEAAAASAKIAKLYKVSAAPVSKPRPAPKPDPVQSVLADASPPASAPATSPASGSLPAT